MSLDDLQGAALRIWERLYDAHQAGRGARISFEGLELWAAIDGFVIERFGHVADIKEERAEERAAKRPRSVR